MRISTRDAAHRRGDPERGVEESVAREHEQVCPLAGDLLVAAADPVDRGAERRLDSRLLYYSEYIENV
jgi:hypothetical protein